MTPRFRTAPAAAERDDGTDLALKLWVVLARSFRAVEAHAEADITRHELTLAEFGVLEALHHKGPLLLGDLQRRILVSSGGVTWLVNKLVKRGLVERRPCEGDRRASYAALTSRGEAFIERIFPEHAEAIRGAMEGLGPTEQRIAISLLRRLGLGAAAAAAEREGG